MAEIGYPAGQFVGQNKATVNSDGESMKELGHAFVSSNQCNQTGKDKDLGAGANAGSKEGMRYVTINPLSELVWSPHTVGGTCGETENLSQKMKASVRDTSRREESHSAEKGMGVKFTSGAQSNSDVLKDSKETVATSPEKSSAPGLDNQGSAASLVFKPEDVASGSRVFIKGMPSNHSNENGDPDCGDIQDAGLIDSFPSEGSKVLQHELPKRSMTIPISSDAKLAELFSFIKEESTNEVISPKFKQSHIDRPELIQKKTAGAICCPHSPEKSVPGRSICAEMGIFVASQPQDERKECSALGQEILPINQKPIVESSPGIARKPLRGRKDEGKALSDEDNQSISKEEGDSLESVESCNSGRLFSSGKRTWSFEQQLIIRSKKIKKQHQGSFCSASFVRQESSFVNWISSMRKGHVIYDPDDVPLAITTKPFNHSTECLSVEKDKNPEAPGCRSMSFQNVFQSLYCPNQREQEKKSGNPDFQTAAAGREFKVVNRIPCKDGRHYMACDEGSSKFNIPISNEMSNQGICPDEACLSAKQGTSAANITVVQEKSESNTGRKSNSCNVGYPHETAELPSSNSFQDDSGSPSEDKVTNRLITIDPSRPSSSVGNTSSPLESLWITRFAPKVSATISSSKQGNPSVTVDTERVSDANRFLPHCKNAITFSQGQNDFEDGHKQSNENQKNCASINIQKNMITPTVSCGSKGNEVDSDQKFKYKLNPILPSHRLKKSEAIASIFARKLDSLRNIRPPKVGANENFESKFCFFCGFKGHTLRDCLHVVESELEGLIRNINLYDGTKESSCLCIRCFQLNHWAIACPYASSRKRTPPDCSSPSVGIQDFKRMQCNPENRNPLTSDSGKIILQFGKKDDQRQLATSYKVSHEENSELGGELMVGTNVNNKLRGTTTPNERVPADSQGESYCRVAEEKVSREYKFDGKHAASCFEENLKVDEIASCRNYVSKQITAAPREIFETIKRLRLSRTDILKWMKSPLSNFCLEGFFLRLRLGKWEEGLGGTGYHVACISGASQERPLGARRVPISVEVGGLKCLIDCRYVSNHDFIEEELMAWWCATLRGDGKLPSEEDLLRKLEEKKKYAS